MLSKKTIAWVVVWSTLAGVGFFNVVDVFSDATRKAAAEFVRGTMEDDIMAMIKYQVDHDHPECSTAANLSGAFDVLDEKVAMVDEIQNLMGQAIFELYALIPQETLEEHYGTDDGAEKQDISEEGEKDNESI